MRILVPLTEGDAQRAGGVKLPPSALLTPPSQREARFARMTWEIWFSAFAVLCQVARCYCLQCIVVTKGALLRGPGCPGTLDGRGIANSAGVVNTVPPIVEKLSRACRRFRRLYGAQNGKRFRRGVRWKPQRRLSTTSGTVLKRYPYIMGSCLPQAANG